MIIQQIAIFLFGLIIPIFLYFVIKVYKDKKNEREKLRRAIINRESDGWINANGKFVHWWDGKAEMLFWRKSIDDEIEFQEWLDENIVGDFELTGIDGTKYVKFDKEEDGVAYKLKWG